jgi:hypothetical protein
MDSQIFSTLIAVWKTYICITGQNECLKRFESQSSAKSGEDSRKTYPLFNFRMRKCSRCKYS